MWSKGAKTGKYGGKKCYSDCTSWVHVHKRTHEIHTVLCILTCRHNYTLTLIFLQKSKVIYSLQLALTCHHFSMIPLNSAWKLMPTLPQPLYGQQETTRQLGKKALWPPHIFLEAGQNCCVAKLPRASRTHFQNLLLKQPAVLKKTIYTGKH